jgi:ABC-type glycerol-3-phosphate transport system substrate-binding protein
MDALGLSKQRLIIIGAILVVIVLVVLGVAGLVPIFKKNVQVDPNFPTTPVQLTVWGVDDQKDFGGLFQAYAALPEAKQVSLQYKKFSSEDEYERALVNAFAEGKGPDVFMVRNTWIYKHQGKMAPTAAMVTPVQVRSLFPSVVAEDFVMKSGENEYVFALPLYMDTLQLFYNKEIFDAKGILYPPKTWQDVGALIPKIREMDGLKNIKLAALAMGGIRNVRNMPDILSVIMMQNGGTIYDKARGSFNLRSAAGGAVPFYLQFSNPISSFYTWNDSMADSRKAFAGGQAAMILDYREALSDIKERNAFMAPSIASLPQASSQDLARRDYASYWGLAVAKQSKNPYVAWHFVRFATLNGAANELYLKETGRLPALLSLISKGIGKGDDVFLRSFLTAHSWQQPDPAKTGEIFEKMFDSIASGKMGSNQAIGAANDEMQNLYKLQ